MGMKENKKCSFYDYTADEMKVVVKRNMVSIALSVVAIAVSVASILIQCLL